MSYTLYACLIGFLLDLVIGDPQWLYHPIRLVGKLIEVTEKVLRKVMPDSKKGNLLAGMLLVMIVVSISTFVPLVMVAVGYKCHPIAGLGIESILCYFLLATKSLKTESMKVYESLKKGDLAAGRKAVSMIVGRDTASLDEKGVAKAAIETVAENTSDGVIAPLLFMIIGGAPLGFFYKSINTLDSMVGYKNDQYLYFGRVAAKVDDVVNYIPARIAANLMMLAAYLLRMDGANSVKIYNRDRYKHASPNSAQTEAVCAGALRVQLAGDAYYFGKLYPKEYIGDPLEEVVPQKIVDANRLLYGTAILAMILLGIARILLTGI